MSFYARQHFALSHDQSRNVLLLFNRVIILPSSFFLQRADNPNSMESESCFQCCPISVIMRASLLMGTDQSGENREIILGWYAYLMEPICYSYFIGLGRGGRRGISGRKINLSQDSAMKFVLIIFLVIILFKVPALMLLRCQIYLHLG